MYCEKPVTLTAWSPAQGFRVAQVSRGPADGAEITFTSDASQVDLQEILRTVQAFQSGGLCGAEWKKGEKFVA